LFGALGTAPLLHWMITVTRYGVVVGELFVTYVPYVTSRFPTVIDPVCGFSHAALYPAANVDETIFSPLQDSNRYTPEQDTIRLSPASSVLEIPLVILVYASPRMSSMIRFAMPVAWIRSRPYPT
jgi:hypothetical protein